MIRLNVQRSVRNSLLAISTISIFSTACIHSTYDTGIGGEASEQWYGKHSFCGQAKNIFNLGRLEPILEGRNSYVWLERTYHTYGRTGVLVSSILTSTQDGKIVELEKGTTAFAMNHRSERTKRFRSENYRFLEDDPVEWCFVEDQKILVCAEWAGNDNALYLKPKANENLYIPALEEDGVIGPAPHIEETPVDLGFYFMQEDGIEFSEHYPRLTLRRTQHVDGDVQPAQKFRSRSLFVQDTKNFEFQKSDIFRIEILEQKESGIGYSLPAEIFVEREQTSWPLHPLCGEVDLSVFDDE